ncbi:MAG: membrane protein [Ginsengibacter sp.]
MKEALNKVAKVTVFFWIMKVLATTLGEILGDFFSMTLNLGYVISLGITVVIFLILLVTQLKAQRFHAILFWLVIVGTTTVGTEISDLLDRTLHLGYKVGSLVLFLMLLLTLLLWHRSENKIKVHPITDLRVEIYYWIAILFSNSLGTAFGDYLSDNMGFSYLMGAAITGIIIIIVVLVHYFTKLNEVLLFWIAFIFTRPFGATFGDFLTKPIAKGGLNFGRGIAAIITALLLAIVMYFSSKKDKDARLA